MVLTLSKGELVALMGPSGCGKTTLLNVLARRAATSGAKTTGECYVNGGDLDNATFGRITSYVEQEDALIGSLTVQETLKFAADLSLPRYASNHRCLCYKAYGQGPAALFQKRSGVTVSRLCWKLLVF